MREEEGKRWVGSQSRWSVDEEAGPERAATVGARAFAVADRGDKKGMARGVTKAWKNMVEGDVLQNGRREAPAGQRVLEGKCNY